MGDFCPIVLVLACSMDYGREDVPMCSRITPKLVGDQLPGCLSLLFQGSTKEAFSGLTISTLGNQNIDHVSILIDGPPKIEALTRMVMKSSSTCQMSPSLPRFRRRVRE